MSNLAIALLCASTLLAVVSTASNASDLASSASPSLTPQQSTNAPLAFDVSAATWLERMSVALKQQQFKQSIIHVQTDGIQPLIYLHGLVGEQEVAFLEHLNGPPQSAVRVGEVVTFLEHDKPAYSVHASRIEGVWPEIFAGSAEPLSQGYELILGGRGRIAGRPGQMIRIVSKDGFRYNHQIWIDMESYLPLRYELLTQEKQLVEQLMVVELMLLPTPPTLLVEAAAQTWPPIINSSEKQAGRNWQFSWLPQGFEVLLRDHHRLLTSKEEVEYIALTDGLSDVSIYVAMAGATPLPAEVITRDGLSIITQTQGNAEIVVMGKLPVPTLKRIAASLRLD